GHQDAHRHLGARADLVESGHDLQRHLVGGALGHRRGGGLGARSGGLGGRGLGAFERAGHGGRDPLLRFRPVPVGAPVPVRAAEGLEAEHDDQDQRRRRARHDRPPLPVDRRRFRAFHELALETLHVGTLTHPRLGSGELHADNGGMLAPDHLAERLLPWFDARGRTDVPWRKPGTPAWGVLVSEVMSQQTQVARAAPVWEAWMERWPTPADLAAAPTAEVLRAWGRMGYPRRALRLQECARILAEEHDGVVPSDPVELEKLPGIGVYTAAAVAVFHYGRRHAVVDTNVRRVVARLGGEPDAGTATTKADLAAAEALLPAEPAVAARVSVALMELGALVCTARKPECGSC